MPTKADALLKEYRAKRDFGKTAEPSGKAGRKQGKQLSFVVQKHDATRLHYDFRLELDGVLKSWAVTKGPSADPADKRLAVRVEDHPLDYGEFEGTIPEAQYGGGTVMLWDRGTWEPIGDPHAGLEKGDLKFRLDGERLKGEWVLVHMKGRDQARRGAAPRENWLLIKHRDEYAAKADSLTQDFTTSVATGRDLDGIARGLKPRRKSAKAEPATKVWTHGKAVALPPFRPPQLATLVDTVPTGKDWLFEMKLDGYRCLAAVAGEEVRLYTRNGNDWTRQFQRMVAPLSQLTKGSALVDGEICAFKDGRSDFSTLKDALSRGGDLVYYVFDLLEIDGETLEKLPLVERKARLEALTKPLGKDSAIQYSDHVVGNGQKVFDAMCKGGYEGVIAKLAGAPYVHDRTKTWLKIKCLNRQEFVIGGWRPSDKHSRFASLLLGAWDGSELRYHGRVGTGFTVSEAKALQAELDERARKTSPFADAPPDIARRARWVTPELVAEIAYTEMTPDGSLRHPSFIGLRQDKPAKQVRMETPKPVPENPEPAPKAKATPKAAAKAKAKALEPVALTDEQGVAAATAGGIKLSHPERVVYPDPGITKGQVAAYYAAVSERILPHLANRPLSLLRCPQGSAKHCFFQKHDTGSAFPSSLTKMPIVENDGELKDYLYLEDEAGVLGAVQMNTLEFHVWGSSRDDLERPERVIFDIDPDEGLDFTAVKEGATHIRDVLGVLGLTSFPMVTGGKGIHVIAPLTPKAEWPAVKAFCRGLAVKLSEADPDRFVANVRKAQRHGRMFVDYLRNERGQTAIAPWSTRARDGAPAAVPVSWDELGSLPGANIFTLPLAAARAKLPDPWPGYFKLKQAITAPMLKAVDAEV